MSFKMTPSIETIEIIRTAHYELEQAMNWAEDGMINDARTHFYKAEGMLGLIQTEVFVASTGQPRQQPELIEWAMLVNTLKLRKLVAEKLYKLVQSNLDKVQELMGL